MLGRPGEIVCQKAGAAAYLTFGWCVAVMGGFYALAVYDYSPGPVASPPHAERDDPTASSSGWRLVVGVHPQCPCTRATVANLKRLQPQLREHLEVQALIFLPPESPPDWAESYTVRTLLATSGVKITNDPGGELSNLHGIQTSGGVVLYDPTGAPRFHGGITPSRGHEGDCIGASAIRAIIADDALYATTAPVFGCLIQQREAVAP